MVPGLFVLSLVALAQTALPTTVACRLERSLDVSAFAGLIRDLEVRDGRIYLLDAGECAIWVLDLEGRVVGEFGAPGRGPDYLVDPYDLFWGPDGRLHVTDVGQRRVKALDLATGAWSVVDSGYSAFYGAGDESCLVYGADRAGDPAPLRVRWPGTGEQMLVGQKILAPPGPASLRNNLNHVRVAAAEGLIACGHVGLGWVQLLDRRGRRLGTILLDLPEAHAIRRWFWQDVQESDVPAGPFSLDGLIDDMARMARPDRFPFPVYVSDLAIRGGRVHVLCKSTILRYGTDGRLRRRLVLPRQADGRKTFVHEFAVLDDGAYCGVDTRHYLQVHFLRVP